MTAKEFLKQKNIIDIYWIEYGKKGKGIKLYKLLDEFAQVSGQSELKTIIYEIINDGILGKKWNESIKKRLNAKT